jgi:lactate permease
VLGAIFLLSILRQANVFSSIEHAVASVSKDKRIQAIIVGWFFVAFLEGIAGFGTPVILAAPILMALGFSPLASVVIALVGDSVAVTFGAVGLPMTIGIAQGVGSEYLAQYPNLVRDVAVGTAFIHLVVGAIIPIFISVLTTFTYNRSIRQGLAIWPFALVSGMVFLVPLTLSAVFLPTEFPSIVASLVGVVLIVAIVKLKFLTPKVPFEFEAVSPAEKASSSVEPERPHLLRAAFPYGAILAFLVVSRIPTFGFQDFLRRSNVLVENIFGTSISYALPTFYSPGFIFLLVGFLSLFLFRLKFESLLKACRFSLKRIFLPFVGLIFVLGIVQTLVFSSANLKGLPSMPLYLAELLAGSGAMWPIFAPLVGALGAFMSGSSTVSNLLFASFQAETAVVYGFSIVLILSLQAAGSAVGNMIAIHNILAAQAAVGLKNSESKILHYTLIPALIFVLFAGILGLIFAFI